MLCTNCTCHTLLLLEDAGAGACAGAGAGLAGVAGTVAWRGTFLLRLLKDENQELLFSSVSVSGSETALLSASSAIACLLSLSFSNSADSFSIFASIAASVSSMLNVLMQMSVKVHQTERYKYPYL